MRALIRTWRAIPWPGALLALAAWGLLAPDEARAGCRHPGLSSQGLALDLDRLMLGDEAPMPKPAPLPAPCKGPSCSGQEAPPPAPISTTHDLGQRWALGGLTSLGAEDDSEFAPSSEATARPVRHPLTIFHPPRPPRALATS